MAAIPVDCKEIGSCCSHRKKLDGNIEKQPDGKIRKTNCRAGLITVGIGERESGLEAISWAGAHGWW